MTDRVLSATRLRPWAAALLGAAAVVWGSVTFALPTQPPRVQVGDTAPDFALKTPDGTAYRLSELRGKQPVVLVFFRGVW